MKRLINRVLEGWGMHPALSGLKRDDVRERIAYDIVDSMRKKSTGNGWYLDLSPGHMREITNPRNR